jgi:type III secretion system chaperone SycN
MIVAAWEASPVPLSINYQRDRMGLQTERRLEQFLQLADLPSTQVSSRMEFSMPPFQLYVECLEEHILLTLSREIEDAYQGTAFVKSLSACHPARTQGTPIRTWQLKGKQMLSCSPGKYSDVSHWLACLQTMRRMLEIIAGGHR